MAEGEGGGRTLLVPKGPRAEKSAGPADGDPTIAQLRATLFSMPMPPNPTQTRTYSIDTILGRIMRLRGLSITEVAKLPGGPSARQVSDHLRGLRPMSGDKLDVVATGLGIDRRLL